MRIETIVVLLAGLLLLMLLMCSAYMFATKQWAFGALFMFWTFWILVTTGKYIISSRR